jgi:glycosyltransferase involved in cell wall biosynthesis
MRVALVMPFANEHDRDAEQVLRAYPIERELPLQLARLGHDLRVFHHAPFSAKIARDGVCWEFVRPSLLSRAVGEFLFHWKRNYGPAYYQIAPLFLLTLRAWKPQVVHFFGLTMDLHLALIARMCAGAGIPLVVHYHGGLPSSGRLARIQRHNLRRVDRVLVTAIDQAQPWLEAGMLRKPTQVRQVLETSSPFRGIPRIEARRLTRMDGDPVYLSVGRLHPIKDPLTVVRGFARIAAFQPGARLYCYYLTDELLPELADAIATDPALRDRVELRGRVGLDAMEAIYSSADFLLQASRREWSGLAVLEAMSCGCIPIVTNIPSFAAMTAGGRSGRLFAVGDPIALADAALSISPSERVPLAAAVKQHFEAELSFAALAHRLNAVYRDVLNSKAKHH